MLNCFPIQGSEFVHLGEPETKISPLWWCFCFCREAEKVNLFTFVRIRKAEHVPKAREPGSRVVAGELVTASCRRSHKTKNQPLIGWLTHLNSMETSSFFCRQRLPGDQSRPCQMFLRPTPDQVFPL